MNQPIQHKDQGEFEGALQVFYRQERAQIEVPLERLLARAESVYLPIIVEEETPKARGWLYTFSRWWVQYSLGAAAIAAACTFFMLRPGAFVGSQDASIPGTSPAHPSWLQRRGDKEPMPVLEVAAKRAGKVLVLLSGERVLEGDGLRIIVAWKQGGFVFLLHRSARGRWTPVYPASSRLRGFQLPSKKRLALPGSLEVTDAPEGDEEFWACFSNERINYKTLTSSIDAMSLQRTKAPPSCRFLRRFVLARPKTVAP